MTSVNDSEIRVSAMVRADDLPGIWKVASVFTGLAMVRPACPESWAYLWAQVGTTSSSVLRPVARLRPFI